MPKTVNAVTTEVLSGRFFALAVIDDSL